MRRRRPAWRVSTARTNATFAYEVLSWLKGSRGCVVRSDREFRFGCRVLTETTIGGQREEQLRPLFANRKSPRRRSCLK